MKMLFVFALILVSSEVFADRLGSLRSNADVLLTTQAVSGSSLPFLSSTSTETISAADFEFNSANIGPVYTDSANCKWRTTVSIAGNLITTLVSCPIVTAFIPCTPGVPYGILLSLTCPRP